MNGSRCLYEIHLALLISLCCLLSVLALDCGKGQAANVATAGFDAAYSGKVLDRITRKWVPPHPVGKFRMNVVLSMDGDGILQDCKVALPTGLDALDVSACAAARDAAPFGRTPDGKPATIFLSFWADNALTPRTVPDPEAPDAYLARMEREASIEANARAQAAAEAAARQTGRQINIPGVEPTDKKQQPRPAQEVSSRTAEMEKKGKILEEQASNPPASPMPPREETGQRDRQDTSKAAAASMREKAQLKTEADSRQTLTAASDTPGKGSGRNTPDLTTEERRGTARPPAIKDATPEKKVEKPADKLLPPGGDVEKNPERQAAVPEMVRKAYATPVSIKLPKDVKPGHTPAVADDPHANAPKQVMPSNDDRPILHAANPLPQQPKVRYWKSGPVKVVPPGKNIDENRYGRYLSRLSKDLSRVITIPASIAPGEYYPTVEIQCEPMGKILYARIIESSGNADLDDSIMRGIRSQGSVLPPARGFGNTFEVIFNFVRK